MKVSQLISRLHHAIRPQRIHAGMDLLQALDTKRNHYRVSERTLHNLRGIFNSASRLPPLPITRPAYAPDAFSPLPFGQHPLPLAHAHTLLATARAQVEASAMGRRAKAAVCAELVLMDLRVEKAQEFWTRSYWDCHDAARLNPELQSATGKQVAEAWLGVTPTRDDCVSDATAVHEVEQAFESLEGMSNTEDNDP